jgi:hypothetical protein
VGLEAAVVHERRVAFYVSVKRDVRAVACVKVGVVFERGDESGCSVQRGRRGGAVDCAGAGGFGEKVVSVEERAARRLRLIKESEEGGWYPAPP